MSVRPSTIRILSASFFFEIPTFACAWCCESGVTYWVPAALRQSRCTSHVPAVRIRKASGAFYPRRIFFQDIYLIHAVLGRPSPTDHRA